MMRTKKEQTRVSDDPPVLLPLFDAVFHWFQCCRCPAANFQLAHMSFALCHPPACNFSKMLQSRSLHPALNQALPFNASPPPRFADAQRSLWTVRDVAGQQVVVRRARPGERAMPHGYWTKVENVELELRSGRLAASSGVLDDCIIFK